MADEKTNEAVSLAEVSIAGLEDVVWYGVAILLIFGLAFAITAWLTRLQPRLRKSTRAVERLAVWMPAVQLGVWFSAALLAVFLLLEAPVSVVIFILIPAIVVAVIGSRDLARNIIAGAFLAFERTILVGDIIRIDSPEGVIRGEVAAIGLRRTLLHTLDGTSVVIPNQSLLNATVRTNRSHDQDTAVEIEVPISPGASPEELSALEALAVEAASVSCYASPRRRPEVFLRSEEDGRVRMQLTAFAFSPGYSRHLETDVLEMVRQTK